MMADSLSVWVLDPANLTPFYSFALCQSLHKAGDRVRFVTTVFSYDSKLECPAAIELDNHYFRSLMFLQNRAGPLVRKFTRAALYGFDHRRLLKKARKERPDIVHIQWSRVPQFDLHLIQQLKQLGVSVVHTVHDVKPLYSASGGAKALGRVYTECDALVVHTEANRREMLLEYPAVDPMRIHVIAHGPLQSETSPSGATQQSARRELSISQEAIVLLFFGTIKPYKGLDLLVRALSKVDVREREVVLLVAGRPGGPQDVPDFSGLETNGVGVCTEFGFIPNQDVWKYYLAADLSVLPYRAITQSGVLLSTFAFGKPAIVTAVGGLPELVQPGKTGWVVPPEDEPALIAAIDEAIGNKERLAGFGRNAQHLVETEYDWETIGQQTHQMYSVLRSAK